MKKIFLVALAGMLLLFSSCKRGSGDPKTVLIEFFNRLSEKDFAGARKLATTDSKKLIDMVEKGMKTNSGDLEKYRKENIEFGEAKIDGDKATVPVKETESGETLNFLLRKENGSWKVAFNKSTFFTVGLDKLNEEGFNMQDSLGNAIDQMNNINMDSLENALKKGQQMMDSAMKELEKLKK